MLVRARALEQQKQQKTKVKNVLTKSAEKRQSKRGRTRRAEPPIELFRQPQLNTEAYDEGYPRVGSVSPLKVRPVINMDGLQEEEHYERCNSMKRGDNYQHRTS